MAKIHTQIQEILNNYTDIQGVSDEVNNLMLEISNAVSDDIDKINGITYIGETNDFMKMSDINAVREAAQSLQERNNEMQKEMEINKFFSLHALKIHPRDHPKLLEISKLYVENKTLNPDNLLWLGKHADNSPQRRAEEESVATERKKSLIKLGGLKIKK